MKDMVEEILTTAERSTNDFRETAYPEDPLRYLFSDWVPYYRMKWAIARVIQPESILEIGVRFGYSALAFLSGSPSARYVGIDLDLATFGGSVGAVNWARKACSQYDAEFVIADSTKMERFPGGRYDLIHIMQTKSRYTVSVELRNGGHTDLKSADPYPIHLLYHWLGTNGQYVIFDGERTRLVPDARSGSSVLYEMNVIAPDSPGTYFLRVTLVQERIKWFDQASESLCRQLQIVCTDKLECVAGVSRV